MYNQRFMQKNTDEERAYRAGDLLPDTGHPIPSTTIKNPLPFGMGSIGCEYVWKKKGEIRWNIFQQGQILRNLNFY